MRVGPSWHFIPPRTPPFVSVGALRPLGPRVEYLRQCRDPGVEVLFGASPSDRVPGVSQHSVCPYSRFSEETPEELSLPR